MATRPTYAIVLHAGAAESWIGDSESHKSIQSFLGSIITQAEHALTRGAPAIDVVVDVVAALEDYPEFNAGRGSALNIDGIHELEAAVVDGNTSKYRAVAGLQHTKNPVRLASAMLSRTGASFIFGKAAEDMGSKMGFQAVENPYFTTPKRKKYWESQISKVRSLEEDHGTAGAVALDLHGNLAAANTTGGMTFKVAGRLGDTAVLGAGLWADKRVAVACSGSGEAILQSGVAGRIAADLGSGKSLDDAARGVLLDSAKVFPRSSCGIIAVSADGNISIQSNSRLFTVAASSSRTALRFAKILPSSFPILSQHVFYSDDMMQAGLAKYPTIRNQIVVEIRKGLLLQTMDLMIFLVFFSKICKLTRTIRAVLRSESIGFCTEGNRRTFLFPVSHGKLNGVFEKNLIPSNAEPSWRHCPDGGSEGRPQESKLEAGQCLRRQEPSQTNFWVEDLDDGHFIKFWSSCSAEDSFSKAQISRREEGLAEDLFSLPHIPYNRLISATWKALRVISTKFKVSLQSLGIEALPMQGISGPIIVITLIESSSQYFPAPAPYHEEYRGDLSKEYGALPPDLEVFSSLAHDIRTLLRAETHKESQAGNGNFSVDALNFGLLLPAHKAEMQQICFHELFKFLGSNLGYRFSPKISSMSSQGLVSMPKNPFTLLAVPYDFTGVYDITTLPNATAEPGAPLMGTITVSVVLSGTPSNGMETLGRILSHLIQVSSDWVRQAEPPSFEKILQRFSTYLVNLGLWLDGTKISDDSQQISTLIWHHTKVGCMRVWDEDLTGSDPGIYCLYGDATIMSPGEGSTEATLPKIVGFELDMGEFLELLWK